MNGCYIRALSPEAFHEMAMPFYKQAVSRNIDFRVLSEVLQPRTEVLGQIPEEIKFLENVADYSVELYNNKKMKTDPEVAKKTLALALETLKEQTSWDNDTLFAALKTLAEKEGLKNGQILYPVRIALSGRETTPGGATELAVILGKEETLKRISEALQKLA